MFHAARKTLREFHLNRHMGGQREAREKEAEIADLATSQKGLVDRDQLLGIGFGGDAIDARIRAKRLHRMHRGVYAVGHRHINREGRLLAAVLSAGEGAVLSHRSAAVLWGLRTTTETEIDVIAPVHRRGDHVVRIHQNVLRPDEITTRQGIPVTTPVRTIVDLAGCVEQRELERAIRQAVYDHLTTTTVLAEAVEQYAGRRGVKRLRAALVNLGEAPGFTRSKLEDRFIRFLRKHSLPMPELNFEIDIRGQTIEADCVWEAQRVIVEVDGRDAHDSTPAFESDRARDSALAAAGWQVVRATGRRMRFDGDALASELRQLLARRAA